MAKNARNKNGRVFSLTVPSASSVLLVGDFTEWEKQPIPLKKNGQDIWTTTVKLPPGTHHYRFLVDGQWQDDPVCAAREANAFGTQNCVCQV